MSESTLYIHPYSIYLKVATSPYNIHFFECSIRISLRSVMVYKNDVRMVASNESDLARWTFDCWKSAIMNCFPNATP